MAGLGILGHIATHQVLTAVEPERCVSTTRNAWWQSHIWCWYKVWLWTAISDHYTFSDIIKCIWLSKIYSSMVMPQLKLLQQYSETYFVNIHFITWFNYIFFRTSLNKDSFSDSDRSVLINYNLFSTFWKTRTLIYRRWGLLKSMSFNDKQIGITFLVSGKILADAYCYHQAYLSVCSSLYTPLLAL